MKNEDLETAERQNRFLVYGTAGPDKIKVRGSIGIALMGGNYIWTMSKLISATAFPIQSGQSSYAEATVILREGYGRNSAIGARVIMPDNGFLRSWRM